MGARQGCVGFGYLVSPLGPPLLLPLATAASAAATAVAAAAVHSIPHFHPFPRQQPLSLPSVFLPPPPRRRSPFAQPLSLTLPFCRLFFPAARLSAVLLVFLTKDPLNTSAVITSRQPPRVARLPQQTHPLIQPPPRASTGPTNRRATT